MYADSFGGFLAQSVALFLNLVRLLEPLIAVLRIEDRLAEGLGRSDEIPQADPLELDVALLQPQSVFVLLY
jgi:hypothetical protein